MAVKKIPHNEVKGAVKLTPQQMNKIAFGTGHQSQRDTSSPK